MQFISNMYISHLILYLHCKIHGNIPNDCQDIANLLLGYFNLGYPVYKKEAFTALAVNINVAVYAVIANILYRCVKITLKSLVPCTLL